MLSSNWVLTLHSQRSVSQLLTILRRKSGYVRYYAVSQQETTSDGAAHWHAYVRLSQNQRASFFEDLRRSCWIQRLERDERDLSLNDSILRYLKYIEKNGPLLHEQGERPTERAAPRSNNSAVILQRIRTGSRMSEILLEFPAMYATIAKLMLQRPRRVLKTNVLYIWGPTGGGKTTMVYRVLSALAQQNICDYYSKGGGLRKFWDGYDNQPIAWIDDPVSPQLDRESDSVQQLKNVMSVGDCIVEIKYGSLVFDSAILIITSNIHPVSLANACGDENRAAIYRRLTDTCGAFHILRTNDMHYMALVETIAEACGLQIPTDFLQHLPPFYERDFSSARLTFEAANRHVEADVTCDETIPDDISTVDLTETDELVLQELQEIPSVTSRAENMCMTCLKQKPCNCFDWDSAIKEGSVVVKDVCPEADLNL